MSKRKIQPLTSGEKELLKITQNAKLWRVIGRYGKAINEAFDRGEFRRGA